MSIPEKTQKERSRLASGEKPPSRIKNPVQRNALQYLALFFALMLVFTLCSRALNAVAIARVQVDTVKSGVLTDRVTINGELAPLSDLDIELPQGLRVESVHVKKGQTVAMGDALLSLKADELDEKIADLRLEIQVLDLKISAASQGISGSGADGILETQLALANAKEDYARLLERQSLNQSREGEDLLSAEDRLKEAQAAYDTAVKEAKEDLTEEAREKLTQARENLEETKQNAQDAIRQAEQAVTQARESQQNADTAYYSALNSYNKAKTALDTARQTLLNLEGQSPQDPAAIAQAKDEVAAAQSAFDQAESMLNSQSGGSSSAHNYAKEELKITKERWEAKIKKAEEKVAEAETKLQEAQNRTDVSKEPQVVSAKQNLDAAQDAVKNQNRGQQDGKADREEQLKNAGRAVESAEMNLRKAEKQAVEESKSNQNQRAQGEVDALQYRSEKSKLERQLELLEQAGAHGGMLRADSPGTVSSIIEKGSRTQADTAVVTLNRSDQGFSFTGKVESKQAQKLASGDKGSLTYTHEGKSKAVEVSVSAISAADEEGNVEVSGHLPGGSYPVGGSGQWDITRRSETKESCLPISALRSGSEGDYVLVLREKRGILGTEHTVVKAAVTVTDRDSQIMSIESTLLYEDRVVISANKPIVEGDRVRLEETQ